MDNANVEYVEINEAPLGADEDSVTERGMNLDEPPRPPPRTQHFHIPLENMREFTENDGTKWYRKANNENQQQQSGAGQQPTVPRQPRLTYTDVKEDINRSKMENVFGKTEFGRIQNAKIEF